MQRTRAPRRMSLWTIACAALLAGAVGSPSQAQIDTWWFNDPPTALLFGWDTELDEPADVAFDDSGLMYVANSASNSIIVFSSDWGYGNPAPLKVLAGPSTLLNGPAAIEFDDDQNMYVANVDGNSVTVYAPQWEGGDTAPLKTLVGEGTQLGGPQDLAFDSVGRMYVANALAREAVLRGSVTVYDSGWASGATPPVKVLSGGESSLLLPSGVAFDSSGQMYVVSAYGMAIYPEDWAETTKPLAIIAGPSAGLDGPTKVAIDDLGRVYVSNSGRGRVDRPHVTVFGPDDLESGSVPIGLIATVSDPAGLALDSAQHLFLAHPGTRMISAYRTQSVTLVPPDDVPWTVGTVAVSAQASSALPVSVASTTPDVCVIDSGVPQSLKIKSIGTCNFTVAQQGSATWLPALAVAGSFSITKAPQTVDVTTPSNVSLTKDWVRLRAKTSSRLPVVWTSTTPAVCLPRGGFGQRVRLLAEGSCSLTATQAGNSLWEPATASVSFEVSP